MIALMFLLVCQWVCRPLLQRCSILRVPLLLLPPAGGGAATLAVDVDAVDARGAPPLDGGRLLESPLGGLGAGRRPVLPSARVRPKAIELQVRTLGHLTLNAAGRRMTSSEASGRHRRAIDVSNGACYCAKKTVCDLYHI